MWTFNELNVKETEHSIGNLHTWLLFKVLFNISPSVPRSPKLFLPSGFSDENPLWMSYLTVHVMCLHLILDLVTNNMSMPVTVAAQSEAWIAFARSDAGIVGSNPTQGMDVWCVYAFILCLADSLEIGLSLIQGVLPSVKNDYGTE
jgi:hypothetical protein